MSIYPKLNNWYFHVLDKDKDPYTPPEMKTFHLSGFVTGHPGFVDNSHITTSEVKSIRRNIIRTLTGTEYELLNPLPEYEKLFPNSLERLRVAIAQKRKTDFSPL